MIRYNEIQEEKNFKKEQKFYNLEKYNLLNKIQDFEEENRYIKVILKDSFPYQLIISSSNNGYENILIITYDQPQVFEMEIIPEIIVRYSAYTTIGASRAFLGERIFHNFLMYFFPCPRKRHIQQATSYFRYHQAWIKRTIPPNRK